MKFIAAGQPLSKHWPDNPELTIQPVFVERSYNPNEAREMAFLEKIDRMHEISMEAEFLSIFKLRRIRL